MLHCEREETGEGREGEEGAARCCVDVAPLLVEVKTVVRSPEKQKRGGRSRE